MLDGMIVAPIDFGSMERAIWNGKEADLGVEIFSTFTNLTTESWLNPTGPLPKALDPGFLRSAYLTHTEKWPMFSDRYGLFFYTTPLFEAQSPLRLARTATTAGVSLSLLATLLVAIITRARLRQERMTAEIIEARDALAATQRERERFGHDLHDGAIQSLYAVQLGLSRTAETVAARLPESAQVLQETRKRVDEVIVELRQFILAGPDGGAPHTAPRLDQVLSSIVRWLKPTTTARLSFEAHPDAAPQINPSQSLALIQIARTALGNAVRHAQAHRISVRLLQHKDAVELVVQDDGIGFDLTQPPQPGKGGMGLHTMRRRSTDVGAQFAVETRPGAGTRISVRLPTRPVSPQRPPSPPQ
jgi:signal transduction histidine kinase